MFSFSFILFLTISASPISNLFNEREFSEVIRLRGKAETREDTLVILESILKTKKYHFLLDFIDLKNPPKNELLLPIVNILEEIPDKEHEYIELCQLAMQCFPEIKEYLSFRYILKLVEGGLVDSALNFFLLTGSLESPYTPQVLDLVIPLLVQHKQFHLLDSILRRFPEDIPSVYWAKGKLYLAKGYPSKAKVFFITLIKKFPKHYLSLDAIKYVKGYYGEKGDVYFYNGEYKKAYLSYKKTQNRRFLHRRLISLYRMRRYSNFIKEYKKFRRKIPNKIRKKIDTYAAYAYWRLGLHQKALKLFLYYANKGDILSARELLDLLLKEKLLSPSELAQNHHIKSPELFYTMGLYALHYGADSLAKKFLLNALSTNSQEIKLRSYFFLKSLGEKVEPKLEEKEYLDFFSLYTRGLPVISSGGFLNSLLVIPVNPDSLKKFRLFLIYGEYTEALRYLPQKPQYLYRGILIADSLAFDNVVIHLSLKLLNSLEKKYPIPLILLKGIFPLSYYRKIHKIASVFGLDPLLIHSLVREESWFNPDAVSAKGAIGLMQLLPGTAHRVTGGNISYEDLMSPEFNLMLGMKYFKTLYDTTNHVILAIAGYNAGLSRAMSWKQIYKTRDPFLLMELIPFSETRKYVERIMRDIIIYKYLIKMEGNQ